MELIEQLIEELLAEAKERRLSDGPDFAPFGRTVSADGMTERFESADLAQSERYEGLLGRLRERAREDDLTAVAWALRAEAEAPDMAPSKIILVTVEHMDTPPVGVVVTIEETDEGLVFGPQMRTRGAAPGVGWVLGKA